MNNLFFKSSTGLTKNSSITLGDVARSLEFVLKEQRNQRTDLQDIKRMINRLLVDKHLQQQVDEYFTHDEIPARQETEDLD